MIMNIIKKGSDLPAKEYVEFLKSYYKETKKTSPIHIDTLIMMYKITSSQIIFLSIFYCHYFLLIKILREGYNRYRGFLYEEDYNDLRQRLYIEFFRRILFYKFPPDAPFSKYIKMYLRKWLNTYTKLLVDKNKRFVLASDWKDGNI